MSNGIRLFTVRIEKYKNDSLKEMYSSTSYENAKSFFIELVSTNNYYSVMITDSSDDDCCTDIFIKGINSSF